MDRGALTTRREVRPPAGLKLDQVIERSAVRSEPARSAAAATAAATGLLLRFVDFQRAPVKVLAIQRLHGARGVGVRHFNKPESTRTTGLAIIDQGYFLHRAVGSEDRANAVFSCREGEITNIQFSHRNSLTEKRDWAGINPADWFAPSFARVRDFGLSKRAPGRRGAKGRQAERVRAGRDITAIGTQVLGFRRICAACRECRQS